jgi:hypothetical protein
VCVKKTKTRAAVECNLHFSKTKTKEVGGEGRETLIDYWWEIQRERDH